MDRIKTIEEVSIVGKSLNESPFISIIVPMRNEEKNVKRCITSLMNQNYPSYEIIAVDDMSKDNTTAILGDLSNKNPNLKVVRGSPTPRSWVGKSYALWQGVRIAEGDWLLFIDADTYLNPNTIRSALCYAEKYKVDMLSLFPFQELHTFWERVIQPIIFASIASALPHEKVNNPNLKEALAIGQFILIRQKVYEAVGGHESIRDKIVEDVALAKLVKGGGYRLRVASGRKLIKTRMYSKLGEIWEGWTKNLFLGIEKNWKRLLWALFILSALGFVPVFLFEKSAVNFWLSKGLVNTIILIESSWLVLLNIYVAWRSAKTYKIPSYYSILFPISAGAFILIMLSSAFKVLSGKGVTWKGRRYVVKTII